MQRAIELAKKGGLHTKANPNVGAVLVYNDRIIGEGYHASYGGPHAEVNTINSVAEEHKKFISDATLYVTLEPCCIHSKTPPCTDLILKHKIKNVFIGVLDPNDKVYSKGVAILEENNVKVTIGIEEENCARLLAKFRANLKKRPFVILKWAASSDGFMGHKQNQLWLSSQSSKVLSHKWRSEVDGILIGKNTALIDNPQLTNREYIGESPTRILLDSKLEVTTDFVIKNGESVTYILYQKGIAPPEDIHLSNSYLSVNDMTNVGEILQTMYQNDIYSVIIEGGKAVLQSFYDANMWDEARIITCKRNLLAEFDEKILIKAPNLRGKKIDEFFLDSDHIFIIDNDKK
jgi:diaminohydroxyphosphoribosylaminopyrimidine deaminase / 5-amino-6-(5-phosphoribosylamino)uracil reductase